MECEACGDTISLSTAYRDDDGNFVCQDCHTNAQQHRWQQSRTQQRTESAQQHQAAPGPTETQTEQTSSEGSSSASTTQRAGAPRADTSNASRDESPLRPAASPEQPASQNFKALLRLGKFISGCGWLIVVVGVIGLLISFTGFAEMADSSGYGGPGPFEVATAVGFCIGSLLTSGMGLVMAAAGQQISCFVAIERNTRSTYEMMRAEN